MIDSLEPLHVFDTLYIDVLIGPIEIPTAVLCNFLHSELHGHTSNHVVLAIHRADC